MKRVMEARPSPAMVVALIALFVALGGSAAALTGSNTVQSDDLGPGAQVKAPDVADNAVNGADVLNNSLAGADINNLTGADVTDNSLTGADVNESTLSGGNAATVGGARVCDGVVGLSVGQTAEVCSAGPLSLTASCSAGADTTFAALTLDNTGADHAFWAASTSNGIEDADWNDADPSIQFVAIATNTSDIERASFSAGTQGGSQLAGEAAARARHIAPGIGTCHFSLGVIS